MRKERVAVGVWPSFLHWFTQNDTHVALRISCTCAGSLEAESAVSARADPSGCGGLWVAD